MKQATLKQLIDSIGSKAIALLHEAEEEILAAIEAKLTVESESETDREPTFSISVPVKIHLNDTPEAEVAIRWTVPFKRSCVAKIGEEIPGQLDAFDDDEPARRAELVSSLTAHMREPLEPLPDGGEYLVKPISINGKRV